MGPLWTILNVPNGATDPTSWRLDRIISDKKGEERMNKKLFWIAVGTIVAILVAGPVVSLAIEARTPVPAPTVAVTAKPTPEVVITEFSFTDLGEGKYGINVATTGQGGVGLTIRVSYNTSPKGDDIGEWVVIKELGVPWFSTNDRPVWNTSTLKPGTYLVRADVKTSGDPNWKHPTAKYVFFVKK